MKVNSKKIKKTVSAESKVDLQTSSPKTSSAPSLSFNLDETDNVFAEHTTMHTIKAVEKGATKSPRVTYVTVGTDTVQVEPQARPSHAGAPYVEPENDVVDKGHDDTEGSGHTPPPAYADIDSDSDNDIMAEEHTIAPTQFHGTAIEEAEQWLCHFENYYNYKTYDDDKKLALCKVLLANGAANWLDALPNEALGTWGTLKEKFLERYLTPEDMHFKSTRTIMNTKMEKGQSVDDYVAKMQQQQLAQSTKADDKMVRFAIINGLLPHISNYVTQKQPKTMTELLEAARIAEMTVQ